MEETPVVETLDVPISFNLLSSGDGLTTRVSPDENDGVPNAPLRDNKVDLVKVYVYQRKEGGSYVNKTDGFMKSSEYTLNAIEQAEWPHYIAEGIIQLQSGYEYRITAVAYGEKEFNESILMKKRTTKRLSCFSARLFITSRIRFSGIAR